MAESIKCEKCGHENLAEPEGQCEKCGEYLYQFYLKNIRKKKHTKLAVGIGILCIIALAALYTINFTAPISQETAKAVHKGTIVADPVKTDLTDYLKQIVVARNNINNSSLAKTYLKYVGGILDEDDQRVILAKLGLQEPPDSSSDKFDAYWKEYEAKSVQLAKSKSIKERFIIMRDYFNIESRIYSQITPVTNDVETAHKYLIRSKELLGKAYGSFISGMDLKYISNVKEDKEGSITWSYSIRSKEYSDNFKQYKEAAENESKSYTRTLEQLVLKHDVLAEYKSAYPFEGWVKERNIKKLKENK